MCDFLAGRLIVSHHSHDVAARELIEGIRADHIQHVTHIESMEEKLKALGFSIPESLQFELHLLKVPDGEEIWKINYLRFFYQHKLLELALSGKMPQNMWPVIGSSNTQLLVVPDSNLSLGQTGSQVQFQFDPMHATYKQLLGLPHPSGSTGSGVTVAILDTGLEPQTGIVAASGSRNFHEKDKNKINDINDTNGHGTAVTSIIHDLAPDADILVLKVGDGNPMAEWNVLAALLATGTADIVNLSLAFGMPFRNCYTCGRNQTHSSRSAVFEQIIDELRRVRPDTIIVAAAGNRQKNELDFPARFAEVVAVGAVDSQRNRPAYSNYGAVDQVGDPHTLLFFAPGGGNGEYVATTTTGAAKPVSHEGTSFAAPYVSGLVAVYQGQPAAKRDRASTLGHFKGSASQNLPGYATADFGNGLIQV